MKVLKSIRIDDNIWKDLKIIAIKNGKSIPGQIEFMVEKEKSEMKKNKQTEKDYF